MIRGKMSLICWWIHWFWIIVSCASASAAPISSYETISTSLKSALIQNENAFPETSSPSKFNAVSRPVALLFDSTGTDEIATGVVKFNHENNENFSKTLVQPTNQAKQENGTASLSQSNALEKSGNTDTEVLTTVLIGVTESIER
jgi:uncharacterized protein YkwD